MTHQITMGNDNGNAHHNLVLNGEIINQVNVNKMIYTRKGYIELTPSSVLKDIMNQLLVTISSPSVKAGTYLIGASAMNSGKTPTEFNVGFEDKSTSELPIVNTLGVIAAYAVKQEYVTNGKPLVDGARLDVKVDMSTALPIKEFYTTETAKTIFAERFMKGPHVVTVHLGNINIAVYITTEFAYTTPEASSVYWFLQGLDETPDIKAEVFEDYMKTYDIKSVDDFSAKDIADSICLHTDVGSGTSEFPKTRKTPDPAFIVGKFFGTGHAIMEALSEFGDKTGLPEITRLQFDQIIKDKTHHQHHIAASIVEPFLREQSENIVEELERQIRRAQMNVDYLPVYGGGSILMKEHLHPEIKKLADSTGKAKIIYIPEKYAVNINALGLYAFAKSKVFEAKKQAYLKANPKKNDELAEV